MSKRVLEVRGVSKYYRLGVIGGQTLQQDISRWWAKINGKPDPLSPIVEDELEKEVIPNSDKDYIWALNNINIDVNEGEILGIIGHNGAGKSTLLKILSKITAPTRGEVKIKGRIGSLLEVGTGFHPELTGRENIYLNGAILGMTSTEVSQKLDEITHFSGVEKYIDTPVKRYSSGMIVRLGFAVAAHLEPEILVIDEVLAVGDFSFQKKCLNKMGDISREGRTILLVSHNMASINNICNRAIILKNGRSIFDGKTSDAVSAYLKKAGGTGGQIAWDQESDNIPGNEYAQLISMSVHQDGNLIPCQNIDLFKDIEIHISYRCLIPETQLYTAFWLKDANMIPILSSANLPHTRKGDDKLSCNPHKSGIYTSICTIPGPFLNEGGYHLTAILGMLPTDNKKSEVPWITITLQEDALSFIACDMGEMRKEGNYGRWLGILRIPFEWNSEFISA